MITHSAQRGGPADVGTVVADLRTVFNSGRTRDLRWRTAQLSGVERLLMEREVDMAAALAADLGRTATEAWLGDVVSTRAEAVYARKHLKRWMRRRWSRIPAAQMPGRAWVQYEPKGVVLVIGAWNYPWYLSLAPLVAALAAGNCAVLKPSELAPATSAALARLLPLYVDGDAVRVVEGDASVTQGLLAQGFDHALFTGGTEVGRKIMASAAATLTPVTLELGGKSPVIVAADADLQVAARRIVFGKMVNSGQTCIAPDYVLVDQSVAAELVESIGEVIREFSGEHSTAPLPIVDRRHFDRLVSLIDTTTGRVVIGGGADDNLMRIQPTVIVDPAPSDPVMVEEIFGPILPVLTFESFDAAIDFVNMRPKPLALYVFSASTRRARAIIDRTSSGGAVINHVAMHCLIPQLPFGGVGASGFGAYHGRWGFEEMSHRRAVLHRTAKPDPRLIYPPYTDRALAIMRRIL